MLHGSIKEMYQHFLLANHFLDIHASHLHSGWGPPGILLGTWSQGRLAISPKGGGHNQWGAKKPFVFASLQALALNNGYNCTRKCHLCSGKETYLIFKRRQIVLL